MGTIIHEVAVGSLPVPPSALPPNTKKVVGAPATRNISQAWAHSIIQLEQPRDWTGTPSVYFDMQNTTLWSAVGGWRQAKPLVMQAPYTAINNPLPFNHNGDPAIVNGFFRYWRSRAAENRATRSTGSSKAGRTAKIAGGTVAGVAGVGLLGAATCICNVMSSSCGQRRIRCKLVLLHIRSLLHLYATTLSRA